MIAQLCEQHPDNFWGNLRWVEFEQIPNKQDVVVLVPVVSFTDWGYGLPLDAEEMLVMTLLKRVSEISEDKVRTLVTPPCRFAAGPWERTAFPLPLDLAFAHLRDWGLSIAASGFRKIAFVSVNPFLMEILDASGRDLRIEKDLQMFCLNLEGLGLSFHSLNSGTRTICERLLELSLEKHSGFGKSKSMPEGIFENWSLPEEPAELKPEVEALSLDAISQRFLGLLLEIRDKAPFQTGGRPHA